MIRLTFIRHGLDGPDRETVGSCTAKSPPRTAANRDQLDRTAAMTSRKTVEVQMEAKIAQGDAKVAELKAKLAEAGDRASDEAKEALASAEKLLEASKKKLGALANASDDKFDEIMADAKETWDDLSAQIEGGWAAVTEKIKNLFS